ncbi:hypothetical protein KIL84_011935, partial [Mauremys mutica]
FEFTKDLIVSSEPESPQLTGAGELSTLRLSLSPTFLSSRVSYLSLFTLQAEQLSPTLEYVEDNSSDFQISVQGSSVYSRTHNIPSYMDVLQEERPQMTPTWQEHRWLPSSMPFPPLPQRPCWNPWAFYHRQFAKKSSNHWKEQRRSYSPQPPLPPPMPEEETFEGQEAKADKASPLPDKAVRPSQPFMLDDFRQFQELIQCIADTLQVPLEKVQESDHKLLHILHTPASMRIAIAFNETLMDPTKTVCQTPAIAPPTCKRTDIKYYLLGRESEFLFSHPPPNSLVMEAINEQGRQHSSKSTCTIRNTEGSVFLVKNLTLQSHFIQIENHQVLMAKSDCFIYNNFNSFIEHLPEEHCDQFKVIIQKGQLLAKTSLQASLDAAGTAAQSQSTSLVMRRASSTQLSERSQETSRVLSKTSPLLVTSSLQT